MANLTVTGVRATATGQARNSLYRQLVVATAPSGYWRFDEFTGTVVAATVGVAGTYSNATLYQSAPLAVIDGTSISFNGDIAGTNGSYADFGDNFTFAANAAFSVGMWIYPTTIDATARTLAMKYNSTALTSGWVLSLATGALRLFREDVTGAGNYCTSSTVPTVNNWSHVVGTYDGTTLRLYLNGALVQSLASSRVIPAHTDPFRIGNASNSRTLTFAGRIDEPAVWSRALTLTEVTQLYNPSAFTGGDGLLTAPLGPLTASSGIALPGDRGDVAASGQAGLTGMFSAWTGPGVNAPFVIGVRATATATAQPGVAVINSVVTQNATVVGVRASATATARPGVVSTSVIAGASLVVEVDFVGNATAPYFDQVSQQTGAAACWRFDDNAVLVDEVGSSGGTVTGLPTLITGALAYDTDQQLRFDGTTQYAQAASTPVLTPAGSYSMSGWFLFTSLPSAAKVIFTKGSYRLLTTAANKLSFTVTNDVSGALTNTTVTTNSVLAANTQYHVVCVHDADEDELRIYLNGVLDNTANHSAGTEIFGYPLTFAGRPYGTAPAFRAVSTSSEPAGSSQSLFVIPRPTYAQSDLLFAHICQRDYTGGAGGYTLTPPVGWTLLSQDYRAIGGFGHWQRLYWKYADVTEPSSYTWTSSVATQWSGAITSFSNVNATFPFAKPVYSFPADAQAGSFSTRSHLIDAENTLALGLISAEISTGANAYTWSSGTERYDVVSANVASYSIGMASQIPTAETAFSMIVTTVSSNVRAIPSLVVIAGTGVGTYTAVDLDEWSFSTVALSDSDVAEMYEARLSGVATWTDVSADARTADLSYGRQYELNRMESGHANVTLKNLHRRYDPANTSSIYYPNVKPNRKIRMRALLNGNYYPLWEGLVDRWPSDWGISWNYDEVKLTVSDGYKALNRAGVSSLTGAGISGTQLDTFLSRALWPIDKREIDTGEFIMAAETTDTITSALTVIQDIADSELGQFFIDHTVDGSPCTFHDRSRRWTNTRSLTSQVTFTDQPGGIRYTELDPSEDDDNVANEWIVTSANGTTGTAIDATSRQQNYPVTGERTTRLDNPDDAIVQARALLQQTARPGFRFDQLTVRLTTQTVAVTWQTMFELAISDRVTVVRNPVPAAGGSTITKDCFIEGISWSITPNYWDVSFQLSPISSLPFYDSAVILDPVSYWRMDEVT